MRDWIIFIGCVLVYTGFCMAAGMVIEYKAYQGVLDQIRTDSYVRGVMDCRKFEKDQWTRDQLQGVEPRGPIGDGK